MINSHQEIEIGAEALTPREIAEALSRVAEREIVPVQIPTEEAEQLGRSKMGISTELFFNERSSRMDLGALRKAFPEIAPVRFEE